MYAVIQTGGKQYRVAPGDVLDVELIGGSDRPEAGDKITFDQVLLVSGDDGVKTGDDLAEVAVQAVLVDEVRGPKIRVFKKKRRKQYRRTNGHRQNYHRVKIEGIDA